MGHFPLKDLIYFLKNSYRKDGLQFPLCCLTHFYSKNTFNHLPSSVFVYLFSILHSWDFPFLSKQCTPVTHPPNSTTLFCSMRNRCGEIMNRLWLLWGWTKQNGAGRSQHFFNILCPRAKETEHHTRLHIVSIIFMTQTHLEGCTHLESFNTERIILSLTAIGWATVSPAAISSGCLRIAFPKLKDILDFFRWCHTV